MTNADLEQTGRQLLQLLLQLIPDLWETLTLLVLQFQFLRCGTITLARKQICTVTVFFCFVVVTLCFVIRFTTPSLQRPVVPWGSPSPFLGFPARSCGVGWGCHALSLRWPCLLPPVWSLAVDPGLSTWTGRHMTKRHHCQQSVFNHTVAKTALTEWLFTQHDLIFWVARL